MESARQQGLGNGGARVTFWLSWSLAGLCVAMFVATFPLFVLARTAQVPGSWGVDLSAGKFVGELPFLVFPLVGAMIASRRPRNLIGWTLLADGLSWMLSDVMDYYGVYGVATSGSAPVPVIVAGIDNFMWVPTVGLLGTYVFLLFSDGGLPSGRWRPLAWELHAGPERRGIRRLALSSLRCRDPHRPRHRLRLADGHTGRALLRRRGHYPGDSPGAHRPGGPPADSHRSLHTRNSSSFQPSAATHPVLYRSPLLPHQVRRGEDPRSLPCKAARRDGPRRLECGANNRGARDGAPGACLLVAATFGRKQDSHP